MDAGILITDEVTKFSAGTPRPMYAPNTEPAIVENPEVMVRSGIATQNPVVNFEKELKLTDFGLSHHCVVFEFSSGRIVENTKKYAQST
jgi:hypothetical protein